MESVVDTFLKVQSLNHAYDFQLAKASKVGVHVYENEVNKLFQS